MRTGVLLPAFLLLSCLPQEEIRLPYAPVNLTVNLAYLDKDLVPFYSFKIFRPGDRLLAGDRVGFGGLLVFNNNGNYQAYDIACPVEVSAKTVVTPSEEGSLFVTCPTCGTRYSLIDGGIPVEGTGTYRLQPYNVFQKSATELIISN
ncbi:MAG: (2Fe-2S)-binding protein [Tannerellaceae bacterium]|jgi:nitrite reductase/ring-hydroxylating ferredoxin subunit|nr:(2Fe-2S)-binding protein [Tannerellaceae bacterium]